MDINTTPALEQYIKDGWSLSKTEMYGSILFHLRKDDISLMVNPQVGQKYVQKHKLKPKKVKSSVAKMQHWKY